MKKISELMLEGSKGRKQCFGKTHEGDQRDPKKVDAFGAVGLALMQDAATLPVLFPYVRRAQDDFIAQHGFGFARANDEKEWPVSKIAAELALIGH